MVGVDDDGVLKKICLSRGVARWHCLRASRRRAP